MHKKFCAALEQAHKAFFCLRNGMDWIYPQLDFQRQVDNERIRLVTQFVHDMHHVQEEIDVFIPGAEPIADQVFKSPLWLDLWGGLSHTETYFDSAVRQEVESTTSGPSTLIAQMLFNVRISNARRVYITDSSLMSQKTNLVNETNRYMENEFRLDTPAPSRTKEQLRTKLAHYNEYINDTARLWRRGLFEEKFRPGSFAEYRRLRNRYACDVRTLYECHRNRTTLIDSEVIDLTGEENEEQEVDSEPVIDLIEEVSSDEPDEIEEIDSD